MRIVAQVQRLQQMAQQMKFVVAIEENSKYAERKALAAAILWRGCNFCGDRAT